MQFYENTFLKQFFVLRGVVILFCLLITIYVEFLAVLGINYAINDQIVLKMNLVLKTENDGLQNKIVDPVNNFCKNWNKIRKKDLT